MAERETALLEAAGEAFPAVEGWVQRRGRVWLQAEAGQLVPLCRWLQEKGCDHLSALSVTDWPEEGILMETCHLWSGALGTVVTVKVRVDRSDPAAPSLGGLFGENARIHERELHELFGVRFDGNPDLAPLFLEEWEGPPPFRKDFDWRAYVREQHYSSDNERERAYYDQ
ncbi:MAG: NADH-quinone oxidoreductase subunit C [Synergistales bacterium]|nr:NADH-quinone oxidoreductase subunit C [Synergistales bacterium]